MERLGTTHLEQDVAALAAMARGSASEGERASAEWIAGRLREAGAGNVAVEAYRGRGTYAWTYGLLAGVGLVASWLPRRVGIPLSLGALAALEADASGQMSLPVGSSEGANVSGRVRATRERRRSVVLVAHHDTQRSGWVWDPRLHEPGAARRLRTRSIPPYLPVAGVALALSRWWIGRALLAVLGITAVQQALQPPVPGANDNASGVAAMLALIERFAREPLEHVEVIGVAPGGEESGMQGFRAWLRARSPDPASILVVCLDTLGCGTPIVLRAEHTVRRWRYAECDLGLVPSDVERWSLGGWTDALQAKLAGLRVVSLLSVGPQGVLTHYHVPSDTPEHVDFASVRACIAAAAATVEAFAAGG